MGLFKRRLGGPELGAALLAADQRHGRHESTGAELSQEFLEICAEVAAGAQTQRLSVNDLHQITDSVRRLGLGSQVVVYKMLYTLFADMRSPVGTYRTVLAVSGLEALRKCVVAAAEAGRLDLVAQQIAEPMADTWVSDHGSTSSVLRAGDGYWFVTKAEALRDLERLQEAEATARQGERLMREYLRRSPDAAAGDRQHLAQLADLLRAQAEAIAAGSSRRFRVQGS